MTITSTALVSLQVILSRYAIVVWQFEPTYMYGQF